MKGNRNKKLLMILILFALSACSSNVSGQWDCPRQEGHDCIAINNADQMALQKIQYIETTEKPDYKAPKDIERKIWFAPTFKNSKESK